VWNLLGSAAEQLSHTALVPVLLAADVADATPANSLPREHTDSIRLAELSRAGLGDTQCDDQIDIGGSAASLLTTGSEHSSPGASTVTLVRSSRHASAPRALTCPSRLVVVGYRFTRPTTDHGASTNGQETAYARACRKEKESGTACKASRGTQ
jgi:hypothetical protein